MTSAATSTRRGLNPEFSLRVIGAGAALCAAVLATFSSTVGRLDESARLARDGLRPQVASGRIALVEIDAKSLAAISDWPWSRRTHAALIDRLRAAGATTIAFDIDFSSTTALRDDQALADALKRAGGGVVLPTFRQPLSLGSKQFTENLPIPLLRAHAFLGSVNVRPDRDGQLRHYSHGTVTAGVPRPSIAALLANSPGNIARSFRVDTAIDPRTIPRVSAVDVLRGNATAVSGRAVLVGATAIEMGDRYVVPGHGVLPGVVIQALAAETLIQGTANRDLGPWPPLLIAALGLVFLVRTTGRKRYWADLAGIVVFIAAVPVVLEILNFGSVQIVPALLLLAFDAVVIALLGLRTKLRENRLTDAATGLPNARALEYDAAKRGDTAVTVVRMQQYDEIAAVLAPADHALLMSQVLNRLAVAFPRVRLHAIEAGVIAWPSPGATEADEADSAAALFRAPIALTSRAVLVTPVFGVSYGNGGDAAHLLARANIAARNAQASGKRWLFESDAMSSEADRSIAIIADVEAAIANEDIYVVYQAKWSVAEARVCGAEALVRWHHRVFGPLGADEFIPILERNGQMQQLTLAVVDICMRQLRQWHAQSHDIGIAINISAALLDDQEFVHALGMRLESCGTLTRHITLELTESATIASTTTAVAALASFRALGVRISIDDYGTGQATITYLKSFPADEVKIDKSFVTNMPQSNGDQIVVRSTIELAHQLGFAVVAEGVEDALCFERLREFGCDYVQGWLIGKPVRADELIEALSAAPIRRAA